MSNLPQWQYKEKLLIRLWQSLVCNNRRIVCCLSEANFPTNRAIKIKPNTTTRTAIRRPNPIGLKSPYPSDVKVTILKYKASKISIFSLFKEWPEGISQKYNADEKMVVYQKVCYKKAGWILIK